MTAGEDRLGALAFCWRVERRDGAGLALTSHDRPIEIEGEHHQSDPGVAPAAITRSLGLEPQSGEGAGALSTAAISAGDLALGRWDGARVTLSAVDWSAPDQARVPLLSGELGEVAVVDAGFSADLGGAASRLNAPVCPTTSPECRAQFGDKACRVGLAGRTIRAKVLAQQGSRIELDRALPDGFRFGRLRFLSGENCGAATVMLGIDGAVVSVRDLPRAPVEPGTIVEVREGCDKRFESCVTRFNNAVNFRGEPHLPGTDLLTRYPGA
jgi:uncharacterized phage protein (TIGR02218 family)